MTRPNGAAPLPPLVTLPGVGDATLARLAGLGIRSTIDLLLHLPMRYEHRAHVVSLTDLPPAATVLVEGLIVRVDDAGPKGGSRVWLAALDPTHRAQRDDLEAFSLHAAVSLVFFGRFGPRAQVLRPGRVVRAWGDTRLARRGIEIVHPEYTARDRAQDLPPLPTHLTPVYPTTEGLSQHRLRTIVAAALAWLDTQVDDASDRFFEAHAPRAPRFADALRLLHTPPLDADPLALLAHEHPARRRLAAEELTIRQAMLRRARQSMRTRTAHACIEGDELAKRLRAALPFTPTAAQERALAEIEADLARTQPMQRLLQGDVGSGKTLVAALASARVVGSGCQAAIMAPTEVLAQQHARVFAEWFEPLGIATRLLVGRAGERARRVVRDGTARIVIGTHALIAERLEFERLGLVVIDEQHRFGVRQRLMLNDKARTHAPHQLVMTATPIPRTLAQTAYADLDLSVIDAKPVGRLPIRTVTVPNSRTDDVVTRLAHNLAAGAQAYWVCPLIENSEKIAAAAAEERAEMLRAALPDVPIGLVHGRLAAKDKLAAMAAFKAGETQLLVATTVIEVGVDVPNATLMVIENCERLGLSQLHQLRGRVGRGSRASHCVLLYAPPLGEHARARLSALRRSNDGFYLAEQDLRLRGAGELLGTRQTGDVTLRVADLLRDAALVAHASRWSIALERDEAAFVVLRDRWLPDAPALIAV